jgi:hypothetical protein
LLTLVASLSTPTWGKTVVTWDFTRSTHGWQGNKHVQGLAVAAEGLAFESTGNDPWIEGPAVDPPAEEMTRVQVRMKSDADAGGELFHGRSFQAGRSVRFTVKNDNQWHEYSLTIAEPLGPRTRFRLDPAASAGHIVVSSIAVETIASLQPPAFERPQRPDKAAGELLSVRSDQLTLEHYRGGWGDFVLEINGTEMAAGYQGELIGLVLQDKPQWLQLQKADCTSDQGPAREIVCRAVLMDSKNGRWQVTRRLGAGTRPGTISVETEFLVDKDREVIHLPWLTLFPGLGTFGERKTQGLFAGLEYLDDEPSSSEADITTPEHVRRAPDPVKVTFPLMAVAHGDRYIGLIWEPSDMAAAVFDSPDRIFNSGAHVMALTAPAVGPNRFENQLAAHTPFTLKANQPLKIRATIIGGSGGTIVPAVQKYVEWRGLPKVPEFKGGFDAAVTLLAHGWLDSAINEGGLFRHAVWGNSFGQVRPPTRSCIWTGWRTKRRTGLAERLLQGAIWP